MKIGGFMKNTFVDYPGKIASIVFTEGCNLNCWYCHNYKLIASESKKLVDENEVFDYLKNVTGLIDGVVVSGGEPTLQSDLIDFIKKIKALGFCVKLDTNGTNPKMLENLLDLNLLDYVAMDVKSPVNIYSEICCQSVAVNNILLSIQLLKDSKIDYEFRTTYAPDLTESDIVEIAKLITPANNYFLQVFREENIKNKCVLTLHKPSEYKDVLEKIKIYDINPQIRGL